MIPAAAAIGTMERIEIAEALGWQSTRLVFNNTPLEEAVAGFNRYNAHQLTIGDPAIRKRTLIGTFRADNREAFVRLLRHSVDVKAELRTSSETVLLPVR
jgi:transmembrane sensor